MYFAGNVGVQFSGASKRSQEPLDEALSIGTSESSIEATKLAGQFS